jgi:CobQ-like glutamine amidotransferase family enzyme
MPAESSVRIGLLLPDVLGTYGDNGNALVLHQRLRWRGLPAEIVPVTIGSVVPAELELFVLGGGEDTAQCLAAEWLSGQAGLRQAIGRGAPMLAVCAGLQLLGHEFVVDDRGARPGLGLLHVATAPAADRAVGEIVTRPATDLLTEPLTGFENHQGHTTLGTAARPLGTVIRGVGNGDGTDGVVQGHLIGTYLHGPVLARNPELADLLLRWAVGGTLPPIDLPAVQQLRGERLRAAGRTRRNPSRT